jgi:hypothetical protein
MRQFAAAAGIAAATLVAWARPARADADSLTDNLGPAEIGVGEARRAGAIGALSTRLNPAGLPLSNELVFDGGFGYRPDDSASIVELAACDSTNAVPGCFYYTYVGSDDAMNTGKLHAHEGGLTLAKALTPKVILGGGVKYYNVHDAGMSAGSGFNWDVGTTVRLTDTLNVAAVGYNLYGASSPQFPRGAAGGAMLRPLPSLSLSFDAVWNLDHTTGSTGRYGGGVEYFLTGSHGAAGYPLRIGMLHDVATGKTELTGGLGFTTMKMGIDVAARKEIAGSGDDLLITAAIRIYGPRTAAGTQ